MGQGDPDSQHQARVIRQRTFGRFIADGTEKWGKVIRAAGIRSE